MKTVKINSVTIKLFLNLNGDYEVTRSDDEYTHDDEIFDTEEEAETFFDSLVNVEKEN